MPGAALCAPGDTVPGRDDLCGGGRLLVLVVRGRSGLQRLTLGLLAASLLEGMPSVSGTSSGGEHVGELIEEATEGEEEDRQHAEEGENGERHGRVQRFRLPFRSGDRAGSLRRAFVSSATDEVARTEKPYARRNAGCLSNRGGCASAVFPCTAGCAESRALEATMRADIDWAERAGESLRVLPRSRASWNALHHADADHNGDTEGVSTTRRVCRTPTRRTDARSGSGKIAAESQHK